MLDVYLVNVKQLVQRLLVETGNDLALEWTEVALALNVAGRYEEVFGLACVGRRVAARC